MQRLVQSLFFGMGKAPGCAETSQRLQRAVTMKDNEDDMRCYVPNSGPEQRERGALGGERIVGQDADASDLSSCWVYKPGGLFAHRMVFFDHAVKWLQTLL